MTRTQIYGLFLTAFMMVSLAHAAAQAMAG